MPKSFGGDLGDGGCGGGRGAGCGGGGGSGLGLLRGCPPSPASRHRDLLLLGLFATVMLFFSSVGLGTIRLNTPPAPRCRAPVRWAHFRHCPFVMLTNRYQILMQTCEKCQLPTLPEDMSCASCEKEARDNEALLREAVSRGTLPSTKSARKHRRKRIRDLAWRRLREQAALVGRM